MKNESSLCLLVLVAGLMMMSVVSAHNETAYAGLKIVPCKSAGKQLSILKKIEITDCKTYPCIFKRGQKYHIKAEFHTHQKLTDLKLSIIGTVNNKNVPFSTNDDDHCVTAVREMRESRKCVMNRKSTYNYEFGLDVLKSYPALHVYVNYMVKSNDKPVFCFTFPARLT
jgi:hypothetical protein